MEEYDQAISQFEKSIQLQPDYLDPHLGLAAAYSLASFMEEAQAEAAKVRGINPKFSLENLGKNGYRNYQPSDKERFLNALHKAGLK